ncbi:pterin-4-alpha-carbinolamine dehydratase [Lewinellaceae bacterium SD302]|nr:pterin-4-alpha-carbinolamine dehydratase [Lewinellaceae bacterium SD302]
MPWTEADNRLTEIYKFEDFKQAFSFMTEVADAAEAANHHPKWTNVYNVVEIELTTHDADNTVTEKDRDLAEKIDRIYARWS